MPTISYFYGIRIYMYMRGKEHPKPHIHAKYQRKEAAISIATGEIISGDLPNRARGLVKEFVLANQKELEEMWDKQEFKKLPPLS